MMNKNIRLFLIIELIKKIKSIATDLIVNTLLIMEYKSQNLDKNIIDFLSFDPDIILINELCEQSNRAVDILKATKQNEMLPRIAQNRDVFDCKWCQFADTCWNDG